MKVTPRTRPHNAVDYSTLKSGDAFLHQGAIWVKEKGYNQEGVRLVDGYCQINMCGDIVIPVDATLTWKHKKVTPKKKGIK